MKEVLVIAENEVKIYNASEPQPLVNYCFYNILTCEPEDLQVRIYRYYVYKFSTYFNRQPIDVLFEYITSSATPSFLYYMNFYGISPSTHILKQVEHGASLHVFDVMRSGQIKMI